MKKYQKIFKALSDTFDITPINSEIDDFETCLNEQGLKIVKSKTIIDLLDKIELKNITQIPDNSKE